MATVLPTDIAPLPASQPCIEAQDDNEPVSSAWAVETKKGGDHDLLPDPEQAANEHKRIAGASARSWNDFCCWFILWMMSIWPHLEAGFRSGVLDREWWRIAVYNAMLWWLGFSIWDLHGFGSSIVALAWFARPPELWLGTVVAYLVLREVVFERGK